MQLIVLLLADGDDILVLQVIDVFAEYIQTVKHQQPLCTVRPEMLRYRLPLGCKGIHERQIF
ncbi:hypothetical protein D3C74_501290 [compost metagenome]